MHVSAISGSFPINLLSAMHIEDIANVRVDGLLWGISRLTVDEQVVLRSLFMYSHTVQECVTGTGITTDKIRYLRDKALRHMKSPLILRALAVGADSAQAHSDMAAKYVDDADADFFALAVDMLRTGFILPSSTVYGALVKRGFRTAASLCDFYVQAGTEGLLRIPNIGDVRAAELTQVITAHIAQVR